MLVEGVRHDGEGLLTGGMGQSLLVHFPGEKELIGKTVTVRLEQCKGFYYIGEKI